MIYQKGDPYDYRDARFDPPEARIPLERCRECSSHLAECDVIDRDDIDERPICADCAVQSEAKETPHV